MEFYWVYKPHLKTSSMPNRRWSTQKESNGICSYCLYHRFLLIYYYGFWFWAFMSFVWVQMCVSLSLHVFLEPFLWFFISACLVQFWIFLSSHILDVCLFSNEKEKERMWILVDGEDLVGVGGGKTIIRIYSIKNVHFQLKIMYKKWQLKLDSWSIKEKELEGYTIQKWKKNGSRSSGWLNKNPVSWTKYLLLVKKISESSKPMRTFVIPLHCPA